MVFVKRIIRYICWVYYGCKTVYNLIMNKEIRKGLGKRIRELRMSGGFTQEKLGEKAGLNYKFIGELERGKVNVSLDSLAKIAEALMVKVGDLFSEEKVFVQKIFIAKNRVQSNFQIMAGGWVAMKIQTAGVF